MVSENFKEKILKHLVQLYVVMTCPIISSSSFLRVTKHSLVLLPLAGKKKKKKKDIYSLKVEMSGFINILNGGVRYDH